MGGNFPTGGRKADPACAFIYNGLISIYLLILAMKVQATDLPNHHTGLFEGVQES
jgi:hypothetical protein